MWGITTILRIRTMVLSRLSKMVQVSVVIPMYNESRYIERCLDSLMKQTMQDFEVILIDDGSTDNSIELAEKYNEKLALTILKQQHGGPGKARNWWATMAKGEILVFVDADMAFDEKYLEELTKPIVNGSEVGTAHGREYVANKNHWLARAYGMIRLAYNEHTPRGGVFRAIKKDVFLSNAGYDNSRYAFEDDMASKVGQALYVPTAICYHNNPESISEIFSHEVRIGESLIAKGMLKEYLRKYRLYLVTFLLTALVIILWSSLLSIPFRKLLLAILCVLIFLIMVVSIKRAMKERYRSHLRAVPIVMVTRWVGYIRWMIRYGLGIKK